MLVPPSPKVQFQLVGLPVERSVKSTVKGTQPEVGVASNAATGGGLTVMKLVLVSLSEPQALVTVRVTL
ncbi:hypothetical protein ES703_119181 [subsurface metagenome]